jgi:hypothetical protein
MRTFDFNRSKASSYPSFGLER